MLPPAFFLLRRSTNMPPRRTKAVHPQHVADIPVDPLLELDDPSSSEDERAEQQQDAFILAQLEQQGDETEDEGATGQQQGGAAGQQQQSGKKEGGGGPLNRKAGASAPEGMRFCSGCRKPQNVDDFEPERKMCFRHKGRKKRPKRSANASDSEPSNPSAPSPLLLPHTLSTLLRAASDADGVSTFSASCSLPTLPGWELVDLELKAPYVVVGGSTALPNEKNKAEAWRRARARARPLVDLIHQSTGYSFVYKDCRDGKKKKHAYSLRYLCAQRLDQDNTKRKSAEKTAEKKARLAKERSVDQEYDEDDEEQEGDLNVGGGSEAGDGEGGAEGGNAQAGPSRQQQDSTSPVLTAAEQARKNGRSRVHLKRMARFDCRGSLIINILPDNATAYFTITHHLQHAEYIDVVGNRLRGPKFHPLPVNLSNTIQKPRGSVEIGDEGQTSLDRAEETFSKLLELVRDLKTKKGGGEEEAAEELYKRSEGCRSWRVSVMEALQKGGTGLPRPEKEGKGKKGRKRAVSEVEGAEDEGAARGGMGVDVNGDLQVGPLQHQALDEDDPLRHLTIEHLVQGINAEHLATLQQALPPLPPLPQPHHPLRHQLGDGTNGDLTVDYSALVQGPESWMDPTLA